MSQLYQPDLYLQERLPRKPYCTDDLTFGIRPRSYKTAITCRYIQVNPPHLRVFLLFDLDYAGAGLAWETNNLPMPAWAAINRANKHAHLAYALSAPVLTADFGGRQAALRYLAAIEAAYRAKLGGDDGYSGLITKNPTHPHWELLRGVPDAIRGYDLPYLADFVDLDRYKPYVGRSNPAAIGLGRNCTVFNAVSRWAYRNIREFKYERGIREWKHAILHQCLDVNSGFPCPMMLTEVQCIAKSISDWVWCRFDITASDKRFAALQAHRNSLRQTRNNQFSGKFIEMKDWVENG